MYMINANSLSKQELKELRMVMKHANTVKDVRKALTTGPVGTLIQMFLTFMLFIGLGFIFLPIMFLSVGALVVPFKVASSNKRWSELLPDEYNDMTVGIA